MKIISEQVFRPWHSISDSSVNSTGHNGYFDQFMYQDKKRF